MTSLWTGIRSIMPSNFTALARLSESRAAARTSQWASSAALKSVSSEGGRTECALRRRVGRMDAVRMATWHALRRMLPHRAQARVCMAAEYDLNLSHSCTRTRALIAILGKGVHDHFLLGLVHHVLGIILLIVRHRGKNLMSVGSNERWLRRPTRG